MMFRKHFDYDVKAASDASSIAPGGPSLTVQAHAEDADINVLMERYGITGKMPENPRVPQYGDFTQVGDFRSALHAVQRAQDDFMALPAPVRARFDNDPQLLLEFVHNDANLEEARRMGLLKEVSHVGGSGNSGVDSAVGAHGVAPGAILGANQGAPGGAAGAVAASGPVGAPGGAGPARGG